MLPPAPKALILVMRWTFLLLPWTLLAVSPSAAQITEGEGMPHSTMSVLDFSKDDRSEWYVINDGVMGGLSQSAIRQTEEGTGIFAGNLSLENNGGFASIRASVGRRDLSSFEGLEVRVRGDGRRYQLRLRTDRGLDGIAYRVEFDTRAGEWTTSRFSFREFQPTFRGRILPEASPLELSRIQQVGFLVADKKPGEFRLEIDSVRAWASSR